MTDDTIKIRSQEESPHGMRVIYRLQGTADALQGVKDWAEDTWGAAHCQGYSKVRQLNPKRFRRPKIFMFSRPEDLNKDSIYIPFGGGPRPPTQYVMKVAIFGKDAASLFKLRWA